MSLVTWRLIRLVAWCVGSGIGTLGHWPGHNHTSSLRVSRHKHLILFSLNMPVLPVQWYVGVGPTCSLYTPAMTIWALIQMITVACCWKVSTNHISNIQYSRRHKNVMNVMWRVEKLRVSWLAWHRWHWPGQNPETRYTGSFSKDFFSKGAVN